MFWLNATRWAGINGVALAGGQIQFVDGAVGRENGFSLAGDLQHDQPLGSKEGLCAAPFGIDRNAIFRRHIRSRLNGHPIVIQLNDMHIARQCGGYCDLAALRTGLESVLEEGFAAQHRPAQ